MASQAPFKAKTLPLKLSGLTDREACIDTIVRFVQGIDDASEELLMSAFDPSVEFDLTAVSAVGVPFGKHSGRDEVVAHLLSSVGRLDTLHQTTNFRVIVEGDEAQLTCFNLAQHMRAGDGHDGSKPQYLMGNRMWVKLVRAEEGLWRMKQVELSNMWAQGDMKAVFSP